MAIDLKRRRVLVVGAAGGIGKAAVEMFASAAVTVMDRPQEAPATVAESLNGTAVQIDFLDNG